MRNNCPSWRINWKRKRNMETGAKWGTCGIIDKNMAHEMELCAILRHWIGRVDSFLSRRGT